MADGITRSLVQNHTNNETMRVPRNVVVESQHRPVGPGPKPKPKPKFKPKSKPKSNPKSKPKPKPKPSQGRQEPLGWPILGRELWKQSIKDFRLSGAYKRFARVHSVLLFYYQIVSAQFRGQFRCVRSSRIRVCVYCAMRSGKSPKSSKEIAVRKGFIITAQSFFEHFEIKGSIAELNCQTEKGTHR